MLIKINQDENALLNPYHNIHRDYYIGKQKEEINFAQAFEVIFVEKPDMNGL